MNRLSVSNFYIRELIFHGIVLRDVEKNPEDGVQGVQWAHHEKLVIIDQSTAFVGGIDLCIGRYEIHGRKSLRKLFFAE